MVAIVLLVALTPKAHAEAAPVSPDYEVRFRLGSTRLDATAVETVRRASLEARQAGSTRVRVVGHADALGPPEFNMALSMRRANAVVRALKQAGVPSSIITQDWKGEFDLAVPTGADNPEPANRRVTISVETGG